MDGDGGGHCGPECHLAGICSLALVDGDVGPTFTGAKI